jgi:hypothetical protein
MDPATFLTELKRRKVYRVAAAYAIVALLLIQAASILFPTFEAPPWVMKVFVTAVILGFPLRDLCGESLVNEKRARCLKHLGEFRCRNLSN